MAESRVSTHWGDCWRVHVDCAAARLKRQWEQECQEFGCHEEDAEKESDK